MALFVLSFVVFVLAVLALGVGVLCGQDSLRSGCGGNSLIKSCRNCPSRERQ